MKRTDHILALTSALLLATEEQTLPLYSIMEKSYVVNELRKPNYVSLGVWETNHEEIFASWIKRLREESVLKVNFRYIHFEEQALPPQTLAALAGSSDLLLEITTSSHTRIYVLKTTFSPQYEITPQQFISLLNSQSNKDLAWARAATLILDSNALNQRKAFPPAEASAYLTTNEGGIVFEYLVGDLLKEVQIESAIYEHEFIIPESLQSLLFKHDSQFDSQDNREFVSLYPLGDVSAQEILSLVAAQPFKAITWEKLNTILKEYADPGMPPVEITLWEDTILKMELGRLKQFVNPICQSICRLCEENKLKPVIPQDLANRFGPDEAEQKRASARAKASSNRWMLQTSRQPWEYYQFLQVEDIQRVNMPSTDHTHGKLIEALEEIQKYSAFIQSPFEEAFRLSLFTLTKPLPEGMFNEEHINLLTLKLQQDGFSERAIENFRNALWIGVLFKSLDWKEKRIQGILAITLADVFGGMGSWNDQYVEQDHEKYQEVSMALFEALRNHLASLLSSG